MTGTNMQLQQVAEQLYTGNVGKAIAEMETYLAAWTIGAKVWLTLSSRNSISTCCSDSTSCSAMWHHTIIRCRIQPSRVSIAG